jgi:hypothetical protein
MTTPPQAGLFFGQLRSLLRRDRGVLGRVRPLPGQLGRFLPPEGSKLRRDLSLADAGFARLANVLLLERHVAARPGHPPGDAVWLARLGHPLTGGSLLGLIPSHDHLSRRVCPRLLAKMGDLTEECTRVMDPCPRRHPGAGRRIARKRAGRALPLLP